MKPAYRLIIGLFFALGLLVCSCSHDEKKTYRIGVSQCSQDDWRQKMNEEIDREVMFQDDVEIEIRSADDSSAKQIADLQYFVDNDFDMIIDSPNEVVSLTPVIREIYENGMPVMIFDRNIDGDTYTARLGADDVGLGASAAHYALSILDDNPRAIEICGLPNSTPAIGRHEGFSAEFASDGGTLVASVPGNWNKEDAMHAVDSLLDIYNNVNLIYAHNDRMAIGASEVARSKGRNDIKIIGIDAAPEIGIQAVADSIIDATLLYPTEGGRIVRTALSILRGEPYEHETILPASSVVDLSNADILLYQNEKLKDETEKLKLLQAKIDDFWARYSSQKTLFYASIVIILLLFGVVFLTLKAYWQHKKHRLTLLSQNKILEEQRDREHDLNDQLQQATQSKLSFFTNVSHDLRTPLSLIADPVAQLAEADNLTPRQQVLIKIANKNVKILRRLINQILDFRKLESGKLALNLAEVEPAALVADRAEAFEETARRRDIKFKVVNNLPDGFTMAVDVDKLERVLFNIIANAFKYTPDNGNITVTTGLSGDMLQISIADDGKGIKTEDLDKIFERFYQVDKVRPKGSGIGLALARAFAELHGGDITLESEPGKGSVFTISLPVCHTEQSAEHDTAVTATRAADTVAELEETNAVTEPKSTTATAHWCLSLMTTPTSAHL